MSDIYCKKCGVADILYDEECRNCIISQQSQLIDKLLEVVEFYGDEGSWQVNWKENGWLYINYIKDDLEEGEGTFYVAGKKARELLNSDLIKKYKEGKK